MDLRRFLVNVAAITLMIVTNVVLVILGIWFFLFIGSHAYSYGCSMC